MTSHTRRTGLGLALALLGALVSTGAVLAQTEESGEAGSVPSSGAMPSTYTWEQLTLPKGAARAERGGIRYVAVDAVPGERTLVHAWTLEPGMGVVLEQAAWSSNDGTTWKPAKGLQPGALFANPTAWLAAGADRLIMVADGQFLTSPDGGKWKQPKWPKKQWYLAGPSFHGVVPTPQGLLAVIRNVDGVFALTSADGVRWREERLAREGYVSPGALAQGTDGTVVVAGADADRAPLLWVRSPEGEWSSVPVPWDAASRFSQLGYAAGRFYIQASTFEQVDDEPRIAFSVWTSPDGVGWEPGPTTGQRAPEHAGMAIGPIDGGVLLVTRDSADGSAMATWSADWQSWTEGLIPDLPNDHFLDPWIGRLQDGGVVLSTRDQAGTVSAWAGTAVP